MKSEKKTFTNNYATLPIIQIEMEINGQAMLFNGLIDTGSTYTILASEIADKYFEVNVTDPIPLTGANGTINLNLIGAKMLRIPNNHRENIGFNLNIYSGRNILKKNDITKIEMILGLSFLEKCTSFWIDAATKVYVLEFFS